MKRKSISQLPDEPGLGLYNHENVVALLSGKKKRPKGTIEPGPTSWNQVKEDHGLSPGFGRNNNANSSRRSITSSAAERSLFKWTQAQENMEKRIENARKKDREQQNKRLPTVAEQAAEDEEQSRRKAEREARLKNASRSVAKSIANTEVANKKELEKYEKKVEESKKAIHDTEVEIGKLQKELNELNNPLPSSVLQSALSFFRAPPRENIEIRKKILEKQIAIENDSLKTLKSTLRVNQDSLDSFKQYYKPMKKPNP